jgi:hypothetical protein
MQKEVEHQQDSNLHFQGADLWSAFSNETDFLSVTKPLSYGILHMVDE